VPRPRQLRRLLFGNLSRQGPKEVIHGKRAVASSQSPIVTQTMLDVMKAGGNAIDAVVAGSITQATVELKQRWTAFSKNAR
jgi:gamma-glutamyltranspeptidase